jgi:hypothetical protein
MKWELGLRTNPIFYKQGMKMKYIDFRDAIHQELIDNPAGLTWTQLRGRLSLPYERPCQIWIAQLEKEIGLKRESRVHSEIIWQVKIIKE